ncbi:MAG: DUF742 domain-containing protein [Actinomycetota bacterium]
MTDFGTPGHRPQLHRSADAEAANDLVRAFVITGGRTRASAPELPIETVVSARDTGPDRPDLDRDRRRVLDVLVGPLSIAEVSAHLGIPLRTAVILVSELVADGALVAGRNADTGDTDFLLKIRSALQLL